MEPRRLADLHMHSIFSDGLLEPEALVSLAVASGLSALALTDHDCIDGYERFTTAASQAGLQSIPGVELSCTLDDREIHLLGYGFDPMDETFRSQLGIFSRQRANRAERIVGKLTSLGIPISMEKVLARATNGNVGRPHIAEEVVASGYAENIFEVFNKYLSHNGKAYEPKFTLSPQQGIQMIHRAGGFAVLAHPGIRFKEKVLHELIQSGLDGIECFHPKHNENARTYFSGLCSRYNLIPCGGSDFHGRETDNPLGSCNVGLDSIERLLEKRGDRI